jgi:peptidoglycan/LPS O-acetylase OafA/YrhL
LAEFERQRFRTDIQGLRAIAVGLVVLYHAGLPGLGGGYIGVDVFFVISGFLITNHLLADLFRSGKIGFASFYAKRARRILPASLLVVVLTASASLLWIAPLQLKAVFQDAAATALYVPNMLFAVQNTDYLSDQTPSLFQHYWSLGVEEQFYIVWPALIGAGFVLVRRSERGLFWGLAALVVISFAAGAYVTTVAQPWAFFSLPTRAWELGVGGLLAFGVRSPRWRPSPAVARLGGWFGLSALVAAGFLYTDATVFPGLAAIGPVIASAAVIYFGNWRSRGDPSVLLSLRGIVFIGTISYSLYLVHWPALVIPAQAGGVDRELPTWLTLVIAVACVPIAWALYRWVERPAQKWPSLTALRPRATLFAAVGASLLICAISAAAIYGTARMDLATSDAAPSPAFSSPPSYTPFVPSNLSPKLRQAAESNPEVYSNGCHLDEATVEPKGCEFGDNAAAPLVELFGDSHAAQWFPALSALAENGSIRLRVDTKSSCPSVRIPKLKDGEPYVTCDAWRASVIDELTSLQPDVVVLANYARSAGFTQGKGFATAWGDGLQATIDALPVAAEVYVLADSPTLPFVPAVCLSANVSAAYACGAPRAIAVSTELNDVESAAASAAGARYVDMTAFICSTDVCNPITGNVLIYRDSNHLTTQFTAGLSDQMGQALGLI